MANIRNVRQPIFAIAWGVICDMIKLKSHWLAAPIAIPISRILVGKISPMYSHGSGPQDMLKEKASRYTIAMPAALEGVMFVMDAFGGYIATITAIISIKQPMANAPPINGFL